MALRILDADTVNRMKARLDALSPCSERLMGEYWKNKPTDRMTIAGLGDSIIWRADLLAKHMRLGKEDLILEVGCGSGRVCTVLRKNGWNAIGMDLKLDGVNASGQYVMGSVENLPFRDESVSLYLDNFVLGYTNMERSVEETRRVLVKGGHAMYTLHHHDKWSESIIEQTQNNVHGLLAFVEREPGAYETYYPLLRIMTNIFQSKDAVADFFRKRGFEIVFLDEDSLKHTDGHTTGLDYGLVVKKPRS